MVQQSIIQTLSKDKIMLNKLTFPHFIVLILGLSSKERENWVTVFAATNITLNYQYYK